jgi:hypothetical protein
MRLPRTLMALSAGALVALPAIAQASSHREAPFVTKSPKVDGTDFYMFRSYGTDEPAGSDNVVLVANYLPLQDAYGGPNYFTMDPEAMYEIDVDNTGSCTSKIAFQFQFQNTLANGGAGFALDIGPADASKSVAVPLINIGPLGAGNTSDLNVNETYTVNMVVNGVSTPIHADGHPTLTTFTKPADDIGQKSFPDASGGYEDYASQYQYTIDIPGCSAGTGKMFVGQRAESFAVNLGPIFDLVDAPAGIVTGVSGACGASPDYNCVPNPLAKKNITSIELEVPAACLTSGSNTVIGGWTSAYLHQGRVLNPTATYTVPAAEGGPWVEVSRLGNPLVNEVVIGLPDKDKWNGSAPADDVANFANYVEYPTLPALISILFDMGSTALAPQVFPRTDLVAAFLTGLTGVNAFPLTDAGAPPGVCDMLRLNTGLPATPAGSTYDCSVDNGTGGSTGQCYLGAALCAVNGKVTATASGCDLGGFPNGRRPGDDVVDIALDVVMGFLLPATAANPLYNGTVTTLTDGVWQNAGQFGTTFPFLQTPNQGANGNGT